MGRLLDAARGLHGSTSSPGRFLDAARAVREMELMGGDPEEIVIEPRTGRPVRRKDLAAIQARFAGAPAAVQRRVSKDEATDELAAESEIEEVTPLEFARASLLENVAGPIIGIGERVGLVREGSRQQIREGFESTREDVLARNTGAVPAALALTTEFITSLVPIAPAQRIGSSAVKGAARIAPKLVKPGGLASKAVAGGAASFTEGAIVGFGDTAGQDTATTLKSTLGFGLIAGLLGASGAAKTDIGESLGRTKAGKFLRDNFEEPVESLSSKVDRAVLQFQNAFADVFTTSRRFASRLGERVLREHDELAQMARTSSRMADTAAHRKPTEWDEVGNPTETHHESLTDIIAGGVDEIADSVSAEMVARLAPNDPGLMRRLAGTRHQVREAIDNDFKAMLAASRQIEVSGRAEAGAKIKVSEAETIRSMEVMEDIQSRWGSDYSKLYKLGERFRDWSVAAILRPLRNVGVLDKKQFDDIIGSNEMWAPFLRSSEALKQRGIDLNAEVPVSRQEPEWVKRFREVTGMQSPTTAPRKGPKTGRGGKPIGRLTTALDSTDPELARVDIFEGTIQRLMQTEKFVHRQAMRNFVANIAERNPEVIPEVFRAEPGVRTTKEGTTVILPDRGGTFTRWRDGQASTFNAPPDLLRALEFLEPKHIPFITPLFRGAASLVRATATGMNPAFFPVNFLKDLGTAAIFTRNGQLPVFDPLMGILRQIAGSDPASNIPFFRDTEFVKNSRALVEDFKKSPGAFSMIASTGRASDSISKRARQLARIESKTGLAKIAARWRAEPLLPLIAVSEAMETAPRLAEFRRARMGGKSIRSAGLDAADVTINFSRAGWAGKFWNQHEAFVNAELQDMSRLAREMKKRPFTIAAKTMAYITLPAIANWLANHSDPDYQEAPEWEKNLFYHVAKRDDGGWVRIPRPLGILSLAAGYMVEKAFDYGMSNDPHTTADVVSALIRGTPGKYLVDQDDNGQLVLNPVDLLPNLVQPVTEVAVNLNKFTGRQIEPTGEVLGEVPEERSFSTTSLTARELGKMTGRSPLAIDHLIRGYLSGFGSNLIGVAESGIDERPVSTDPLKDSPLARLTPLGSLLSRDPQGPASRSFQDFVRLYNLSRQAAGSRKRLEDAGDAKGVARIEETHPEFVLEKPFAEINRQLAEALKYRAAIRDNLVGDTREERVEMLHDLDRQITVLAAEAMFEGTRLLEEYIASQRGIVAP